MPKKYRKRYITHHFTRQLSLYLYDGVHARLGFLLT